MNATRHEHEWIIPPSTLGVAIDSYRSAVHDSARPEKKKKGATKGGNVRVRGWLLTIGKRGGNGVCV